MNFQLIMLDQPILTSDETIKKYDSLVYKTDNKDYNIGQCLELPDPKFIKINGNLVIHESYCQKIIAGIPDKPVIDFSELSEEDIKKTGFIDIHKIGRQRAIDRKWEPDSLATKRIANEIIEATKYGFNVKEELSNKKFSEKDCIDVIKSVFSFWKSACINTKGDLNTEFLADIELGLKALLKPKVFNVEVDIIVPTGSAIIGGYPIKPKISNNSIKLIKIL